MSIQGRLWNAIVDNELLIDSGIAGVCRTEREATQDAIFEQYYEKFKVSLTEAQSHAFQQIIQISKMVASEQHNRGIAEGLLIARELRLLLDNPSAAMRQGDLFLNTPYIANKIKTEQLDTYFKGGVANA